MSAIAGLRWPRNYSAWALAMIMVVVALLAYQQYRWIGKVAEAEAKTSREKLGASLNAFADDFDTEITRVHFLFVGLDGETRSDIVQQAQERLLIYRKLSHYPALIAAVDVEDGFPKPPLIDRGPAPTLVVPAMLIPAGKVRAGIPFARQSTSIVSATMRIETEGIRTEGHAGVQVGTGGPLRIRIVLDQNYIEKTFLPMLVKRHLGKDAARHYDLLVTSAKENRLVFRWGAEGNAPWESAVRTFAIRPDCLLGEGDQAYTISVGSRTISTGARLTTSRITWGIPSLMERAGNCVQMPNTAGSWLVNVRSRPSLREAIGSARRQSLAVSFGVMLVLGAGILVLFVSGHRARELAARHERFAASVSHELRTPLSVISSASANLADGVIEQPDQVRQYGKMIRSHSEQLSAMIENALWFAQRNAQANLETEKIEVEEVISTAVAACGRLFQLPGITLERDVEAGLPGVRGNRVLLLHALQNLIVNAATHGRSGKWISIKARRQEHKIALSVEDRGEGMLPEEVKRVFEPFYRGNGTKTPGQAGFGLGLTLVRKIVEAHGEKVELRSRRNAGTTVSFTLPICESERAESSS